MTKSKTSSYHDAPALHVQRQQQSVDAWNSQHKIGDKVIVLKDDGNQVETVTRSEAFVLSGHTAMISLVGISGCYLLERVRAA